MDERAEKVKRDALDALFMTGAISLAPDCPCCGEEAHVLFDLDAPKEKP